MRFYWAGILAMAVSSALLAAACGNSSDDSSLTNRKGVRGSSGGTSSGGAAGGDGGVNSTGTEAESSAFSLVQPDLLKNCGKGCHDTGTFSPPPPQFLAGPDVYKSIKGHPGIVTRDVFQSSLLTKGPHAGPAVSSLPDFEKALITWLEAEAIAIQNMQLPTTPAFAVVAGENDVDLGPAAIGGLSNVHMKFAASIVGTGILSLTNVRIVAPAGQDVHVLEPKFVRILPAKLEDGTTDVEDPADSFSNADQTVPGGAETVLSPGSVLFSAATWRPFDMAKDKLRIEMTKLEPGKVAVIATAATCADPAGFGTKVLPALRATAAANGTCGGCHGAGLAGLALGSNDNTLVCNQVLGKLTKGNIPNSLMVKHVTTAGHGGGLVTDAATYTALFSNNAAVFFK